jgi:outer membrane biosynthesis protein TonB
MANLKSDLAAVTRTLKQLTKKTEQLAKQVDELSKPKAAKKPKAKKPKKAVKSKAKRRVVAKKRVAPKKKVARKKKVVRKKKVAPKKRVAARRAPKKSASEVILSIMKQSRSTKGVATALLQKKTGFNNQKIRDNIYKLTKRRKIKRVGRGVYRVV